MSMSSTTFTTGGGTKSSSNNPVTNKKKLYVTISLGLTTHYTGKAITSSDEGRAANGLGWGYSLIGISVSSNLAMKGVISSSNGGLMYGGGHHLGKIGAGGCSSSVIAFADPTADGL